MQHVRTVFDKLKMNPIKCAFGVTSGKFLRFTVLHKGIELASMKIKGVIRLHLLRRYGSSTSFKVVLLIYVGSYPTSPKDASHFGSSWKRTHHLNWIRKPLVQYVTTHENSLDALVAQENAERKENALYYLCQPLVGPDVRYFLLRKYVWQSYLLSKSCGTMSNTIPPS